MSDFVVDDDKDEDMEPVLDDDDEAVAPKPKARNHCLSLQNQLVCWYLEFLADLMLVLVLLVNLVPWPHQNLRVPPSNL